jgi:NADPH:quinone reductase-like Zn-dependent oxidoreductase
MSAETTSSTVTGTMRAVRLHAPTGIAGLEISDVAVPRPGRGEALVRVHAASITRDELDWPVDRLPAIPSYEVSGVVAEVGPGGEEGVAVGQAVYALTGFDRDGGAADYVVVSTNLLAEKPRTLGHVDAAALPMAGLTAWQGLFVHGDLRAGQRVLIHGAAGNVGHVATQLARWRGAHVTGIASGAGVEMARALGADQVIDRSATAFEEVVGGPVDLVFDTVGGEALRRSGALVREGGRLVSVAEPIPVEVARSVSSVYFVVVPDRGQLEELAGLVDAGEVRAAVDSVYPLEEARAAFERVMGSGKRGKVVLEVVHD